MLRLSIITITTIMSILLVSSCRKEEEIIKSTTTDVGGKKDNDIKGFFLLNEGNMGSNKASLDYYDYTTGHYHKNIYAERNPGVVKELGDVGNDIQIYGDKLYAVINCSHFIEVMDVNTAKHIDVVSIPNCRYIAFKDKYAYISSYAGPVQLGDDRLGLVAKVDTATLEIVDSCIVGRQPDELVVVGDKLYVANSGGYTANNYDNTVSVIDLNNFEEIKKIEVAINLHRLELDRFGYLWVSSRGDYYDTPSKTFVIDSKTDEVVQEFALLPNSDMTICGDSLYVYSAEYSKKHETNTVTYAIVNTKTREIVSRSLIKDGSDKDIEIPYSISVNPKTKEFFVTDAKDYVTPGKLHCYSPEGKLKWSVITGDIPAHIVFTSKVLENK